MPPSSSERPERAPGRFPSRTLQFTAQIVAPSLTALVLAVLVWGQPSHRTVPAPPPTATDATRVAPPAERHPLWPDTVVEWVALLVSATSLAAAISSGRRASNRPIFERIDAVRALVQESVDRIEQSMQDRAIASDERWEAEIASMGQLWKARMDGVEHRVLRLEQQGEVSTRLIAEVAASLAALKANDDGQTRRLDEIARRQDELPMLVANAILRRDGHPIGPSVPESPPASR